MVLLEFPELRQAFEYDCGANALQSVLAYYGIELSEELLIKEAKTSHSGTAVINVAKTAKNHGLKVVSRKMTTEDIKKYLNEKIPVIVLLQAWSGKKNPDWVKDWWDGHYVVAIGFDTSKIYFEDPYAFKRAFLTCQELEDRWHAIVWGKKYVNRGIAIYGENPLYRSRGMVHMD
jgi:predicted double-glycine peptidase